MMAIGVGYLKFLIFDPIDISIKTQSQSASSHEVNLTLTNQDYCQISNVTVMGDGVPYAQHTGQSFNVPVSVSKTDSQTVSFVVDYDCRFWLFHKSGNKVIMAGLNN